MIFLRGIRIQDLKAILNFMYEGEVNVNQEDLQYFLAAAEELRIKGLSQGWQEQQNRKKKTRPPADGENKAASNLESHASKRQKTSESPACGSSESGEDDVPSKPEEQQPDQENTLSVKSEFNSAHESAFASKNLNSDKENDEDSSSAPNNIMDCFVQAQQNYARQGFSAAASGSNFQYMQHQGHSNGGGPDGGSPGPLSMKFTPPGGGLPYEMHRLGGRNEDGLAHVVVMKSMRGWHCPHCSYVSPSQKGNLKVHILNRHASPGESFGCMFCGKHMSSRSSLQVHISQVHREQNKAKRMIDERMKIAGLEDRLKSEMASGILSTGTAEALRQARQTEERLKTDMVQGLLRNQDERTKEDMVNLLMHQENRDFLLHQDEERGKQLSIQTIPNPSAAAASNQPALEDMEDDLTEEIAKAPQETQSPGFMSAESAGFPGQQYPSSSSMQHFQGNEFPVVYPQSTSAASAEVIEETETVWFQPIGAP